MQNGEQVARWILDCAGLQAHRFLCSYTESQRQAVYHILSRMSELDLYKLAGALEIEPLHDIADILTVISDLDRFELYPDVDSDRKLGFYLVESGIKRFPDSALPYLDYEKIGTDFQASHSGTYIDVGYVVRKDEKPKQTLDADQPWIFKLHLYAPQGAAVVGNHCCLTLPFSPERLKTTKLLIGVTDFAQAHIVQVESPIETLRQCANQDLPSVEALNELALAIEAIQAIDNQLTDLKAILEAEVPKTFTEVAEIIQAYDFYEVIQLDADSPGDYGRYLLFQSTSPADDFDFKEEVRDFIDYEAYGRYKMDETGVRQTNYGLVRRQCEPFPSTGFEMRMG